MNFIKFFKSKFFLGLFIFVLVLILFALSGKNVWFQLDDLGNIVEGLIRSKKDFIRVFSENEHKYIYPDNFNPPKANFFSALYRPLQHIPFTMVYFLQGFNAYAYYVTNVIFHALNSFLLFYLFSFYIPIIFSFAASLLFAFYPCWNWIKWISTLHNFLSIFFMLLSLIFYRFFLIKKRFFWHCLAGVSFLFSILSRENTIFLGLWIFIGVYLVLSNSNNSFWDKLKYSFLKTWLFFVSYFIYFVLRLNAFGFNSIGRTLNNLCLRFPILSKLINNSVSNTVVQVTNKNIVNHSSNFVSNNNANIIKKFSLFDSLLKKIEPKLNSFFCWMGNVFNIDFSITYNKFLLIILTISFIIFLFFSYRKHKKNLLFLVIGIFLFSWPGIVAYPNPRYISALYPFLIFTFFLGISFYQKEARNGILKSITLISIFLLIFFAIKSGIMRRIIDIKTVKPSSIYKQDFDKFFQNNHLKKNANFILFNVPFLSDIQGVFKAYLNNLDLKVSHVKMSTIAQRGIMGCGGDYKVKNVKNKVVKLKKEGKIGFRLISLDEKHCCWW